MSARKTPERGGEESPKDHPSQRVRLGTPQPSQSRHVYMSPTPSPSSEVRFKWPCPVGDILPEQDMDKIRPPPPYVVWQHRSPGSSPYSGPTEGSTTEGEEEKVLPRQDYEMGSPTQERPTKFVAGPGSDPQLQGKAGVSTASMYLSTPRSTSHPGICMAKSERPTPIPRVGVRGSSPMRPTASGELRDRAERYRSQIHTNPCVRYQPEVGEVQRLS